MSELNQFERWAGRAREESAPEPWVVGGVMHRLSAWPRLTDAWEGGTVWATFGAMGAAALVLAVLGLGAWALLDNPLGAWARDLGQWGML